MKKYQFFLIIMTLWGCSLFQQMHKSKEDENFEMKTDNMSRSTAVVNNQKISEQMLTRKDSTHSDYLIRFWPRGIINFSLQGDFSGQFDSIQMQGRQQNVRNTSETLNTRERDSRKTTNESRRKMKKKAARTKLTKVQTPYWKAIIILIILGVAGLFIFKKYTFLQEN